MHLVVVLAFMTYTLYDSCIDVAGHYRLSMELHTKMVESDLVIKFWLSMDKMCQPQNKTLLPYSYRCVCTHVCMHACVNIYHVCLCVCVCMCMCILSILKSLLNIKEMT